MQTTVKDTSQLDQMRKNHNRRTAIALSEKFSKAMLDMARDNGVVPTAQLKQMCGEFAARCADITMQELAVVETRLDVGMSDVPENLRAGTTQEIIDAFVAPQMTASIAKAMMSAGLVQPTLAIPPVAGRELSCTFVAWAYALRAQAGPASMPNAPRLEYGKGTTVYPRASGFAPLQAVELRSDGIRPGPVQSKWSGF